MEKRCYRCKEIKPISDFSRNISKKDGYRSICKYCDRKQKKEEYLILFRYVRDYKLSKGCEICGYNKCEDALEFHHNGDKEFNISDSKSLKRVKEEIKKCILLCSNCHRELHAKIKLNEEE